MTPTGYARLCRDASNSLDVHFIRGEAFNAVESPRRAGVFAVLGQVAPVGVWQAPEARRGTFGIATETSAQATAVRALFATGAPLKFTVHPLADYLNMWFLVSSFVENRARTLFDPYRIFTVGFTEITAPS
jgi:hypothetical protein